MKTAVLLSVRNKATRFPGKVLKPLGALTVTGFLLQRLAGATKADVVVLATSDDPRDDVLVDIARSAGASSFRGSAEDKLFRYRDAAHCHKLDFVVIVDGDDPFVSVEHIDRIIEYAAANPVDFAFFSNLPLGATGFGLRRTALDTICENRPEADTEIWGKLFLEDPRFTCAELVEADNMLCRPEVRMTLDYPEDYAFFTAVLDGVSDEGKNASFSSIMEYLSRNPDLIEINRAAGEKRS